jgi:uncharacterized protein YerC
MSSLTAQEVVINLIESGRTQKEIAEAVGASQATISRIQSGIHKDPKSSIADGLRTYLEIVDSPAVEG